ncbi:glutaredoxin-like protein NrdH [Paenarthrobacter sp. NPDC056912]|uniref:glutaredoxin-like protein NrdH n=1 Tax=Paenarthrobacter sp. NPDC056912 TaxID=3345965 RepID=UPI0036714D34
MTHTQNHDTEPEPVTVYSTTKCVQCDATYRALDKKGISYSVINVEHDPEAAQMVKALGYMKAPVVFHGNDHWTGFRPDKIENLPTKPSRENAPILH